MSVNMPIILNHPGYSVITGLDANPWGLIKFPSIRAAHQFTREYCRTTNESAWQDPSFIGLENQTLENFDSTGISQSALESVKRAKASIQNPRLLPSSIRPAISGGVWDIPAVVANLPLCAKTRVRAKLAPVSFHFLFSAACSLDAREMGLHGAKLAGAIHNYILSGGIVNLQISRAAYTHDKDNQPNKTAGLIVQAKVNTSDLAELSLVFSPAYIRGIAAPIITASSATPYDGLPALNLCPLPGKDIIYCGGPPANFRKRVHEACEALNIA